jgi:hypothetical protein
MMSKKTRLVRQNFLGPDSDDRLEKAKVAIIGLGGGGSHVAQQCAHLGIERIRGFDPDNVEDSNLNRMVGAYDCDVIAQTPKIQVIKRMISAIAPSCEIECFPGKWQDYSTFIKDSDVIFGCVDSYLARAELEASARRFCIPLIDIGMDVHVTNNTPAISGQVFMSLPGETCMWCAGFLRNDVIGNEVAQYGKAGSRPQVIWPNGVLASVAVGLAVELITGFSGERKRCVYLSFDGNAHLLKRHPRLDYAPDICVHYPLHEMGDPRWHHLGAISVSVS